MKAVIDTDDTSIDLEGDVTLDAIAMCITALKQVGAAMAAGMGPVLQEEADKERRAYERRQGINNLEAELEAMRLDKKSADEVVAKLEGTTDEYDMSLWHTARTNAWMLGELIADWEEALASGDPDLIDELIAIADGKR